MFIVSTVQEMTCIFNDMAKTKSKIKHNHQQRKTNITSSPNATNKCRKAAVAQIKKSIKPLTSLEGQGGYGGNLKEGVWRGGVEGGSKRGHPRRETSGGDANELSQRNEQLLVGPDRGLRGQVRDPLEEAGPLMGGREAGQDGMFEGLWGLRA